MNESPKEKAKTTATMAGVTSKWVLACVFAGMLADSIIEGAKKDGPAGEKMSGSARYLTYIVTALLAGVAVTAVDTVQSWRSRVSRGQGDRER